MKQRRISAIVLAMILLLSNICFAGAIAESIYGVKLPENMDIPAATQEVAVEASEQPVQDQAADSAADQPAETPVSEASPAPEASELPVVTNAPEAAAAVVVETPEPTPAGKQQIYVLLFDCGYAFYGENAPKNSVLPNPGDPDGRIMDFVQKNIVMLLGKNAQAVICGYNSDPVFAGEEPVAVDDAEAVGAQFEVLRSLKPGARVSSKPDVVVMELKKNILALATEYDVQLIMFTGGAINSSATPDGAGFTAALEEMRAAGVKILAFGLDVGAFYQLKEGDKAAYVLDQYFQAGEYHAAAIPAIEEEADYAGARKNMMNAILNAFVANELTTVEPIADPAAAQLAAEDMILVWGYDAASNQPQSSLKTAEEFKAFIADPVRSSMLKDQAYWRIITTPPEPDLTPEEIARLEEEENKAMALNERLTQIAQELSKAALDVKTGKSVYTLPAEFDHARFQFSSSDAEVLKVEAANAQLVVTPMKPGVASIICTDASNGKQIAVEVSVINSRLDVIPAENTVSATSYDGTLYWTVKVMQGEQLGQQVTGNSAQFEACTLPGVSWTLGADGRSVAITADAVGEYQVSFEVRNSATNAPLSAETIAPSTITISHPVDAITGPVELITPYFKHQEGQLIALTSGGAPIDLDKYVVSINPADVISIYYGADDSSLYLVPASVGTATITISEKYVNSAPVTFEVNVVSLTSNAMIWVCGAGAVLALIALTAGVVILIGKSASKRRRD